MKYEIVVWINEEGSITTHRDTLVEALTEAMVIVSRVSDGSKVTGIEINQVERKGK